MKTGTIKVVKHDIRDYYYILNNVGKWERIDRECFDIHTKTPYKNCTVEVVKGKRHTIYEY